ncbi:MAG: hypothetical protein CV087_14675 [Candidatus Brocadia sp. WS118]|nr:MAG: hypothetical protein CV087_14675 [Candidatus Brocadia sp. WS118]
MDDIKLVREEGPLRCTSVQHVVRKHKGESFFKFDKDKKEKQDRKAQGKMVAHIKHESTIDKQETKEQKDHNIYKTEDQCGDIIDIEA